MAVSPVQAASDALRQSRLVVPSAVSGDTSAKYGAGSRNQRLRRYLGSQSDFLEDEMGETLGLGYQKWAACDANLPATRLQGGSKKLREKLYDSLDRGFGAARRDIRLLREM